MILFLRLRLSFSFDWEDISNTRDSVSSHVQTFRQKYSAARRIFNSVFSVFGNVMKHYLSSLMYYFS